MLDCVWFGLASSESDDKFCFVHRISFMTTINRLDFIKLIRHIDFSTFPWKADGVCRKSIRFNSFSRRRESARPWEFVICDFTESISRISTLNILLGLSILFNEKKLKDFIESGFIILSDFKFSVKFTSLHLKLYNLLFHFTNLNKKNNTILKPFLRVQTFFPGGFYTPICFAFHVWKNVIKPCGNIFVWTWNVKLK